jgi:hypothetical protein
MKKIFYVPAEYKVSVLYKVEAESVEEAIELAKDSECISVNGPNYVEGSLEIIEEEIRDEESNYVNVEPVGRV